MAVHRMEMDCVETLYGDGLCEDSLYGDRFVEIDCMDIDGLEINLWR